MRRALRVLVVLVLVAGVGYLGASWRYADGVRRVTRDPQKKTPAYVQARHENVSRSPSSSSSARTTARWRSIAAAI